MINFSQLKNLKIEFIIYLIISLMIIFCVFNIENYQYPFKELVFIVSALLIGLFSIWYYSKNKNNLYKVAFVVIILFGLLFVFLSPIAEPSDEIEHFSRAELTSRGVLFPQPIIENNSFKGFESIESIVSIPLYVTIFDTNWDSEKINDSSDLTSSVFLQNPFYLYLVQGFGILLAKLLDLNNIWMLWFARFFNLLFYSTLSAIAIKKTPILKVPMFIVATFPLTVIQAASVSADGFIISFSFIIMAYLLCMYKAKEASLGKRELAIFFTLVLILAIGKVNMGVLALLIFLVPSKNFNNKRDYYLFSVIGIIVILAILLLWSGFFAIDSISYSWRHALFEENNVSASGQLSYMLSNPFETIVTFLHLPNQIFVQVDALSRFYINYDTFPLLSLGFIFFFAMVSFFYPLHEKISNKTRWVILATFFILIVGTYFIQYLTWAPVGSTNLLDAGVVPRYFIPIFLILPLMLNVNRDIEIKNMDLIIFLVVIIFLTASIIFISANTF